MKNNMLNLLHRQELFQNPTAEFRGKPFWALNGLLEEDEMLRQIDIMKQMGFGGFFLHSRTGMSIEYLGEEWFRLMKCCSEYAGKTGMESWLYDEDRWPSGGAGGLVTDIKKYRAMYLTMKIVEPEDFAKNEWEMTIEADSDGEQKPGVLAIFGCRLDENNIFSSKRRLTKYDSLEDGEKAVVFMVDYAPGCGSFNGNSYANTLNKGAMEYFIQITHEAYSKHCGNMFGKEIRGIFTDEPHNGGIFTDFEEGGKQGCPYTPGMMAEFEKRFGYSLLENLPELFLRRKKGEISKVTHDFFELCQELFLECFAQPIDMWCRKHNMIFTGHVLHEDSLCAQAAMQGSLMRFYEYMEYPGIDILSEHNRCYWAVKQVTSVARQLGKKYVLSELYGGTGWQMSFESYKNVGDWQALLGINLRCPHLSWYTMKGEAKRDYPASILHQSGWYKDYWYLEDYFSRIHVVLEGAVPECRLLVINPIESIWARAYSGAFEVLSAADEEMKRLEMQYVWVFHALMDNQIDFDYGEEDLISRHGKIDAGMLRIGNGMYDKVLVAGLDTIRKSTLLLLEDFANQGGQVIFAGDIPSHVDAEKSELVKEFADRTHSVLIPWEVESVAEACCSGKEIHIYSEDSENNVFSQSYRVGEERLVMLLNLERSKGREITVNLGEGKYLERWNPRTGEVTSPDYQVVDGKIQVSLNLEAGGERIYVIPTVKRELPAERVVVPYGKEIEISDSFLYVLREPNICVLDMVSVEVPGKGIIPAQEVLKADRSCRDILNIPYRSGNMFQPWYEEKYVSNARDILSTVKLHFNIRVSSIPQNVELAVEDLEHIRSIALNGYSITPKSVGKWIDICFDKIAIPDEAWKKDENEIEIVMDYYKSSGLEAVYLLGNFAVYLEGRNPVLSMLPERLRLGDITEQGLPFYSGGLVYGISMENVNKRKVTVDIVKFGGSLVKLLGEEEVILAFSPHVGSVVNLNGIEVVLTRRNTFGPLHQYPKEAGAYGPDNFMTEKDAWNDNYQLFEQGLLKVKIYAE